MRTTEAQAGARPAASSPAPGPTVTVWLVRPGDVADDLLDPAERARAGELRRPDDRQRYVAAHVVLRALVGARLGMSAADVIFGREPCPLCGGPHGRPIVAGGDVQISLSRTPGMVAVALAPVVVGVDVESVDRPVSLDDLAVALHPAERPTASRTAALRLWVRKEAYLKGLGTGLGLDPAGVDLSSDPPGWQVCDVDAGPGRCAAVAVRSSAAVTLDVRRADIADLVGAAGAAGVAGATAPVTPA